MRNALFILSLCAVCLPACQGWGKFWEITSVVTQVDLVYSGSPFYLTQDVAMTTVRPTNGTGFETCSANPSLPAGLTLDATTCALSGTISQGQPLKTYTITGSAKSRVGTGTLALRSYFQPKFAYTANATGGTISIFRILANGQLSLQGSVPSGTQTWYGLPSLDHKFLYMANKSGAQITVYTINPTTGALAQITGSPYSTLAAPHSLSFNPAGTVLYVGHDNTGVQGVTAFSVDATTGALTPLNGGSAYFVAAGSAPGAVAVEPGGRHLYAGSTQNALNPHAFSISETTAAITQISGSPYVTINDAIAVAIHPSGSFVYLAQYFVPANGVMAFRRDSATGALQQITGPFATGNSPTHIVISIDGTLAYVANSGGSSVSGFKINSTTGVLTPTPSSPYGTGGAVQGVAIDDTMKYVYAANSNTNDVAGFQINTSTGDLLTATTASPYATGAATAPVHIVVVGANQ